MNIRNADFVPWLAREGEKKTGECSEFSIKSIKRTSRMSVALTRKAQVTTPLISGLGFKHSNQKGNFMEDLIVEFTDEIDDEVETELSAPQIAEAVLYASDWTTETIISQLKRGNININPSFQRRDAWTVPRKSRFIESLILGLPIPQIVLAEKERGKYIVLDGKQRLITLLQFTGLHEGKFSSFKLKGLDVRKDLEGKNFSDLENEPDYQSVIDQFYNHTIRSVVIRNWPNIDFLHLVFVRLNTESVKLSPQELRQALFPGDFLVYADQAASESDELKALLNIKQPDFRMRDVEILVRYLGYSFFISGYAGNLKAFLDYTCEKLNQNWQEQEEKIKFEVSQFEKSLNAAAEIFGPKNVAHKWTPDGFESRLNRAVLDIIAFYLSDEKIRAMALQSPDAVRESFKRLCIEREEFRNSIEKTTKSMKATYTRLHLMGEALRAALNTDFQLPVLTEADRIQFNGFWE